MNCRNVIAVILAAGLLAGCQSWQELQLELGMYPVDPPRAETPMPPPGSVSQANWAAQRTAARDASNQGNTLPVDYKEPEKPAPADGAAPAAMTAPGATPAPGATSAPASKPPIPVVRGAAPAGAAAPATAMAPATPAVVASVPALPAGYKPSPAAADDPRLAAEQQQMAAATGAQPTPPAMAGNMKDMAAAGVSGWRAHLASHRTESAAINEWQELLRANQALYGQFDPQVEWVDTPARGSFARLVLVGFAERKDADAACAKIRSSTRYCASVKE